MKDSRAKRGRGRTYRGAAQRGNRWNRGRGSRVGKKHSPMVGVERSKIVDVENLGIEKTEESGDETEGGEDRCWGLNKGNAELSMENREWLWYEKWEENVHAKWVQGGVVILH